MIQRFIQFIKDAGAKTEKASDRDGFLSYHAESHAAGMGLAGGFMATAAGETKLLGLVYAAAVHGTAKERNGKRRRILLDVVQEMHYALGGIVVGALLGAGVRVLTGEVAI